VLFFVIMTSYLTRNEDADWPGPSTKLLGRRSLEIIVTCLDVFITTAIAAAIYLIGLFLLIIPGIIAGKKLIYSPLIAATQNLNPIEALKESNKFARVNGWSLLIGEFIIIILIIILLIAGAFLSTLSISSVATTVLSLILGLSVDWLACVVLPHMMVIAFKEATVKLNQQSA
jgi:hypothetical protein